MSKSDLTKSPSKDNQRKRFSMATKRKPWCGLSCLSIKGLSNLVKYSFLIGIVCLILYIFPLWRMRQVADATWILFKSTGQVIDNLSKSEQHAKVMLVGLQRSGERFWGSVQGLGTDIAKELHL